MNKLLTKIASLALGAAMAFGVGVAVSSASKDIKPVEATTATMQYTGSSTTNMTASGNASTVGLSSTIFTVDATKQGSNFPGLNKSGYIALYAGGNSTITVSVSSSYTINSITISYSGSYSPATVLVGGNEVTGSSNTYTISSTSFVLKNAKASGQVRMTSVVIDYSSSAKTMTIDVGGGYVYARKTAQIVAKEGNTVLTGVTWDTSNHSVATIDSNGVLTGVAYGQCNITASKTGYTTATAYTFYVYANNIVITPSLSGVSQFRTGETITASNISVEYLEDSGDEGTLTSSQYKINGTLASSFSYTFVVGDIGTKNFTISPVVDSTVEETLAVTVVAAGNVYTITTTVTNGTYSGDTSITDNGGVASVTIAPSGDYKLPTSVSVSGASYTYNSNSGVISLSNATGNVTISAAMVALTEYSISVDETNGSHSGPSTIKESRTASLTFTPDSNYGNPESVTVTGATYTWTRGSGVLSLSNPTGNVYVTYVATGNELTSITLSANSGSYTLGDAFVKPVITAHYSVAADQVVTTSPNVEISGYNPYTTGSQPVTISYTEGGITKSASYTATVSAASVTTTTTWELTDLADLTNSDEFVIARTSSTTVALPSNGGAAKPTATSVTISNNKITSTVTDSILWNVTGNASDGYVFNPKGDSTTWLYLLTDANDGVRIGNGNNAGNKHFTLEQGYLYSTETTYPRMIGVYNNADWRCYKLTSGGEPGSNIAGQTFGFFKKVETQTGSADLIRITATYKGGDKYVGDSISTSDFTVKKQLNTGNELIDVASGYTISANTLTAESNTITVSYTEGGLTETADVVVAATPRSATVTSVTLVQGAGVVKDYIDYSSAAWNYTGLTVHCVWSDSTFNEDLSVADLIQSGDATVSPAKPAVGVTSFTILYEYHEVSMTSNSVTGINVVADYVTGISWTGTHAEHFKAFSGSQLTAAQVGAWSVVPTFAGAGVQSALSFGDYVLKVGTKTISSLPYTWTSDDDGQELSITYGKDVDGNDFVKKNGTAVGNICATINAIDHDEESSGAQSIDLDVANATFDPEGTANTGSEASATISGFTITTDKGYFDAGTSLRVYSGAEFTISSSYTINSVSYTFTGGKTGLAGGTNLDTTEFTETSSAQARVVTIHIEYQGTVTTTTHYANDMNHFDAQKKVVEFAKFMNTTMNGTNVCSGTFANLESAWDDVADKYDELFGASTTLNETELAWAKNMLKYANAIWGSDDEAACVEKAMKTYEHCVSKYDLDAFMSELRSASKTSVINLVVDVAGNAPVIVTVVVSMLGLSAIGGYFFLRKRKEI